MAHEGQGDADHRGKAHHHHQIYADVEEYRGCHSGSQQACEAVVQQMLRRQAKAQELPCVVFAMDRYGEIGAATTKDTFDLWICRDGDMQMQSFSA